MVTRQELEAAKVDVKHAGEAVNTKKVITPRYGQPFKSIPLLSEEFQQLLNNKDMEAGQKLQALQDVIDIALAAGVGAAGWTASLIVDGDKTQKQVNDISKSVINVVELRNLRGVKNGDTVRTLGHTKIGLGGGTYTFEALSSKIDNNGAYVASSVASGVWVLISDLHFENFGVVNDGTDQSAKIQNAINFILENNIQFIEFEKANEYAIATHVSFYQRLKGMGQLPSQKTIVKFNGARLRLLTDNQVGIEVAREHIRLENPSFITSKSGCVGIHNGLIVDNYDDTLRRSSQFMQVISPCTEFLDTAIRFKPNKAYGGEGWGSYYHTIYDHNFRSTNIGFDFAECPSGDNSNTRITIIGGTHIGGACTFLCTNVETITAIGFASEFIKTADSRLPDSKACTIYMPFSPANSDMANGYSVFDGTSEAVTRHYNIQGAEVDVFGRYLGEDDTTGQAFIKAKSTLATRGIEGSLKAIGRGVSPSVSPALILRRYKDKTPNGGSTFSIGESADGSGFRLDAESDHPDWKNQLSLNFSKLIVPPVLKPRVTSNDIIGFSSKSGANLFQIDFSGGSPVLWGGSEWKVNGFNINPVFDKTTSLGSATKRFKKLHAENISIYPIESANPTAVGELNFELTSDTQLKIKVKGNDGVVRSATLTLV